MSPPAPTCAGQSEVGRLRRVIVKSPAAAFAGETGVDARWAALGWTAPPDPGRAAAEFERLAAVLREDGAQLDLLPADPRCGLDSLYPRDAAVVCDRGVLLGRPGKPERRGEPAALGELLRSRELPVLGAIEGEGCLEGGDVVWLDQRTVAVGRGYRTNDEGIRQLRELLADGCEELLVVPLPHWRGPGDVFHLMSILSPLDRDLLLVHEPLLPVPFRETLLGRGFRLLAVPEEEFETLGCNVLALAPGRCLLAEGNPRTLARLEAAGVEVVEFAGTEICRKGLGGPTCLTRPLVREPV